MGAEIVNADALQAYRDLEIGTGKPDAEARRQVPHHLVDVLGPTERFSAGEFARRARGALAEIAGRGRGALVVGGSGLYLRALFRGLAEIPPTDLSIRESLRTRYETEGLEGLREELARLDPTTLARIGPGDSQRVLRALEVALSTGRSLTDWIAKSAPRRPPRAEWIGLTLPRTLLYDRIAERVRRMVAQGWPEEVRRLLDSGVSRRAPALQAIGYSDWIRHLDGELGLEATVESIVVATRRYAKRQETWFRRENGVIWLDAREPRKLVEAICAKLSD